ncbi:MAG: LysR family transcriptional regulator [Candidatus Methanosuratus sp.]|nr:LysR family transcriptional regulator [Candidatus Methanosuratincola sp.]
MEPKFQVWLEEGGRYIIGEKEARILEGIRRHGSIMAAAKSVGVTYAHAWNLIENLSLRVGGPIVSAKRGGESGGGSVLTKTGEELLSKYLEVEGSVAAYLGTPRKRVFPKVKVADLVIVGSSCVGLKKLAKLIEGISVEIVEVGSTAGMTAVMLGEADLAGIHLYDEYTKTYNLPYLGRTWPPGMAVLIKGYVREQGLIVRKGNPMGITSLRKAAELGATIVNRNLGSGTRDLLERMMKQEGVGSSELKGYSHEVRTHEEVAMAVKDGKADVGIGIRAAAEALDLGFQKICEEEFDFVCERRRLNKKGVQAFVNALRSGEFRIRLKQVPGFRCTDETGNIIEVKG